MNEKNKKIFFSSSYFMNNEKYLTFGLAALLMAGCDNNETKKIGEEITLARPYGCEKVKDIRFEEEYYYVLCEESDANLALYKRHFMFDSIPKVLTNRNNYAFGIS